MKLTSILSAAYAATLTAATAQPLITYSFESTPVGSKVQPPTSTLAYAYGTFQLDVVNSTPEEDDVFTYSLSYDTLAFATGAHIHSSDGELLLTLTGVLFDLGGNFIGSTQVSAATTQAIINGAYVDITSTTYPNGEVRDDLHVTNITPPPVVPEVESALLVGGLLVVGAVAGRLRRKS